MSVGLAYTRTSQNVDAILCEPFSYYNTEAISDYLLPDGTTLRLSHC